MDQSVNQARAGQNGMMTQMFSILQGMTAQTELMNGVRRMRNEPIRSYGQRIIKVVQDAAVKGTPSEIIERRAIGHLLEYLDDPQIRHSLKPFRERLSFYALLDKAVSLEEMSYTARIGSSFQGNEARRPVRPYSDHQEFIGQCFDCGGSDHLSRDCSSEAQPLGQKFCQVEHDHQMRQMSQPIVRKSSSFPLNFNHDTGANVQLIENHSQKKDH